MTTPYQDAYDYYTRGAPGTTLPSAFRQKLKHLSKDWIDKLDDEFYTMEAQDEREGSEVYAQRGRVCRSSLPALPGLILRRIAHVLSELVINTGSTHSLTLPRASSLTARLSPSSAGARMTEHRAVK